MALSRTTRLALVAALAATSALAHAAYEFRVPIQGLRAPAHAPAEPQQEGFSLAQLVAAPSPVVLPATEVGTPASVLTTLENRNTESVHIQSISSGLPQIVVSGGTCLGATLVQDALCSFSTELLATNALNTSGAVLTIVTDRGNKTVPLGTLVVTAAQSPAATLNPATALTFDALELDASEDKVVTLTNTGTKALALSSAPTFSPQRDAFSIVETTCGESLAPNESCATTVRFTAQQGGVVGTALRFEGNMPGGYAALPVSGVGLAATAELVPSSSADFGNFQVGGNASRTFTLRNAGNKTATGVYLTLPSNAGLTASQNTCGASAAPISLDAGATCSITLNWQPTGNASLAGAKLVSNGSFNQQAQIALSGIAGSFNSTAEWSSNPLSVVAPTPTFLDFGGRTPNTSLDKVIYLRNTGTHGAMRVSFVLSGDVSQFALTTVQKQYHTGNWNQTSGCGWSSTSPCQTDDRLQNLHSHVSLTVRYTPTATGSHALTITPISDNGTVLPGAITVSGTGVFNPQGSWSSSSQSVVAPTPTYLDFGARTPNSNLDKVLYLRNVGTHGAMRVSFVLSGDVSHFALTSVQKQYHTGNWNEITGCGWTSTSACQTNDRLENSYSNISVTVRYTPTATGPHSLTITPVSDNGTVLPGAITVSGTGVFNAQGAWSSSSQSVVEPTPAYLDFGARTPNTYLDRVIYLRNTGTHGAMRVNFVLSGDVSQFALASVQKQYHTGNWNETAGCGWTSTSACQTNDRLENSYSNISLAVRYTPTATGPHSLTITPVSDNGTTLPGAITLTGIGN